MMIKNENQFNLKKNDAYGNIGDFDNDYWRGDN